MPKITLQTDEKAHLLDVAKRLIGVQEITAGTMASPLGSNASYSARLANRQRNTVSGADRRRLADLGLGRYSGQWEEFYLDRAACRDVLGLPWD